jgi:hypothetical protein
MTSWTWFATVVGVSIVVALALQGWLAQREANRRIRERRAK